MTRIRLFLASLLLLSLCCCGKSERPQEKAVHDSIPGTASAPQQKLKIALVLKTLTNPYFAGIEKGARRAEQEFGVDLQVKTGSQETAIEQQIQIVEELIELKVDAIVITPGDSKRTIPILRKALDAGIVVINLDNPLDAALLVRNRMQSVPYVSVDNAQASYQVVKSVTQSITKVTKAAIIGGIVGAGNSQLRIQGATRAFEENPAIRMVAMESADWQIEQGHDAARRILLKHPDLGILFCANDMMALGAIQYLHESGRKNVSVIGYDALTEARAAIAAGTMVASVDQQAEQQGYLAVSLAVRALHGEKIPAKILVDAQIVNAASLK